MNVLITGCSGLVGKHLVSLLIENNIKVIGYDKNSLQFEKNANFKFEQGELEDFPRLATVMKTHEIDTVVHSGGISHPKIGSNSPNQIIQTNIVGTNNIYEAAKLFGIKKVIYISSGAVYGNNRSPSLQEEEKPTPTSIYGVSKITGEYLAQIYTKQYGLNITILRYPFIYGPGRIMPDPINALIYKAKNKENITLNGLEQRLEFIYVKDAVRAIWLALNSKNTHGEIFNIGTGYLASMKEIVAIVQEIFPNVSIKEGSGDTEYDEIGPLDCTKAKKILHFEPHYSLKNGIVEYADWLIHK